MTRTIQSSVAHRFLCVHHVIFDIRCYCFLSAYKALVVRPCYAFHDAISIFSHLHPIFGRTLTFSTQTAFQLNYVNQDTLIYLMYTNNRLRIYTNHPDCMVIVHLLRDR